MNSLLPKTWIDRIRRARPYFATALLAGALLSLLTVATPSLAAPGDLDTTYGSSGYYNTLAVEEVNASFMQADNKLVLAGRCSQTANVWKFCVSRLTAAGGLDPSFGAPNGRVVFTAGDGNSNNERALSISRLPDGRFIVLGECTVSNAAQFCLVRLTSAGAVDNSFGTAGRAYITVASGLNAVGPTAMTTVKALADGKILLAGTYTAGIGEQRFLVMRRLANGAVDTGFGAPNGYVSSVQPSPPGGEFRVNALHVRPDNRLIAGGHCERVFHTGMPGYFTSESCLWFLNADGSDDATIPGGQAFFNVAPGASGANADNSFTAVSTRADGSVIFAGTCGTTSALRMCFLAINSAQIYVTSAIGGGSNRAGTTALAFTSDGRPLFLGTVTFSAISSAFGLSSMPPDLSGTFDGTSALSSPFSGSYNAAVAGGGVQSDGKIVIAGNCSSNGFACVARYSGYPSAARVCSLDVDGDGSYGALTDGLIVSRVMLGLTGNAVTGGISFPAGATRTNWSALRLFLVTQCGMQLP